MIVQTMDKMQGDRPGVDKSFKLVTFGEEKKKLNAGACNVHTV